MDAQVHGLPEDVPSGVTSAVRGSTQFALDLYRTLRTSPGNLSFSPYSVSVALVTPVDYRIGDVGFRERRSAGSQGGLHGDTTGTLSLPHG